MHDLIEWDLMNAAKPQTLSFRGGCVFLQGEFVLPNGYHHSKMQQQRKQANQADHREWNVGCSAKHETRNYSVWTTGPKELCRCNFVRSRIVQGLTSIIKHLTHLLQSCIQLVENKRCANSLNFFFCASTSECKTQLIEVPEALCMYRPFPPWVLSLHSPTKDYKTMIHIWGAPQNLSFHRQIDKTTITHTKMIQETPHLIPGQGRHPANLICPLPSCP